MGFSSARHSVFLAAASRVDVGDVQPGRRSCLTVMIQAANSTPKRLFQQSRDNSQALHGEGESKNNI